MRFIIPSAPMRRPIPPDGPDWVHEIKWDGWRLQAHKGADGVKLYSRPGNDITARFPWIAADIGRLPRRTLILDGELVAFDDHERPDFHLLRRKQSAVVPFPFDILEINGADLCGRPWRERRRFLERLMTRERDDALRLSTCGTTGLRCYEPPARTASRASSRSTARRPIGQGKLMSGSRSRCRAGQRPTGAVSYDQCRPRSQSGLWQTEQRI